MQFLFYVFATVCILSSFAVVFNRSAVGAVFCLVLTLLGVAGIFVMLGAEFIAMIIVLVYVGAVAVLFLFVVMMMDDTTEQERKRCLWRSILGVLAVVATCGLMWMSVNLSFKIDSKSIHPFSESSDVFDIGNTIYTDYVVAFQVAGVVLLVAAVGAMALTLSHKDGVKKQYAREQILVKRNVTLVDIKFNSGVDWRKQ